MDFTDLILLIGTNPLPNYVSADYFIRHNKNLLRVWAVYSKEKVGKKQTSTVFYARNFKDLLEKKYKKRISVKLLPLKDITNGPIIEKDFMSGLIIDLSVIF